jgi:GDPmannose 4,6-dehydratase
MPIRWQGTGVDEVGLDADGRVVVSIDPAYFRPAEVESLLGDAARAREKLGWQPRVDFESLVSEMVDADLQLAKRDHLMGTHGYRTYRAHE